MVITKIYMILVAQYDVYVSVVPLEKQRGIAMPYLYTIMIVCILSILLLAKCHVTVSLNMYILKICVIYCKLGPIILILACI